MQLMDQHSKLIDVDLAPRIETRRIAGKSLYRAPGAIHWTESRSDAEQQASNPAPIEFLDV